MLKSYGVSSQIKTENQEDINVEELQLKGFTILKNLLPSEETEIFRNKLDFLNQIQKNNFGEDLLDKIKENNVVRLPLAYDEYFLKLVDNPSVISIIKKLIGDFIILHLQNGIINIP